MPKNIKNQKPALSMELIRNTWQQFGPYFRGPSFRLKWFENDGVRRCSFCNKETNYEDEKFGPVCPRCLGQYDAGIYASLVPNKVMNQNGSKTIVVVRKKDNKIVYIGGLPELKEEYLNSRIFEIYND